MTRGRIDIGQHPSTTQRMNLVSILLGTRPWIIVLDGLDTLQSSDRDSYGLIRHDDMETLLHRLATFQHDSFCVTTSRLPLLSMIDVPSKRFTELRVDGLATYEGRDLLLKMGVRGAEPAIEKLVQRWDGHALTLSLIGGLLIRQHAGDVEYAVRLPSPVSGEPSYERVQRVLSYYYNVLDETERRFLLIFSAFRMPVSTGWLLHVLRADLGPGAMNAPLATMTDAEFSVLIARLLDSALLRMAPSGLYSLHPLVRDYFEAMLQSNEIQSLSHLHNVIKEQYLLQAPAAPTDQGLQQLSPLVEAVHHACLAGGHQEALLLYKRRLEGTDMRLSYQLNAYDTVSRLMDDFFPGGDLSREPSLARGEDRRYVLNRKAVALMNSGLLHEAVGLYDRAVSAGLGARDLVGVTHSLQNKSDCCFYLGRLNDAASAAAQALKVAREVSDYEEVRDCLVHLGWAIALQGDEVAAGRAFGEAEELQQEMFPEQPYLTDLWGVAHADYLRRRGDLSHARQVAEANLIHSEARGLIDCISLCQRQLGELDSDAGDAESAERHLDEAVRVARSIAERTVLLEALLSRGRWSARWGNLSAAERDLGEAMRMAEIGGYRIYEADSHVGMAWRSLRMGEREAAEREAEHAERLSRELNYHWGVADVAAVRLTMTR